MSSQKLARAYGWLTLEIWLLIALGGGVRAMNAGLACPDWPLCFGDVIPDYHPQVYFEFIHRAMAGMVAIVSLVLAIFVWRSKEISRGLKWLAGVSLVLLLAQIVFGGLTVLLLLKEGVVATHLTLGISFFAMNLWMYLSLKKEKVAIVASPALFALSMSVFVLVVLQIILGGLVASHYAGAACTGFPLCNGQWVPTWAGPIGLQVIHRFMAYAVGIATVILYIWSGRNKMARGILHLVIFQIGLGIANVLLLTPPLITVMHLAVATAIVGYLVKLSYSINLGFYPTGVEYSAAKP